MKRYLAFAVALSALFIGVRANAGQIAVIDDPDPAGYQLNEGERLIMVVPSVDATSRYVPPEQAFGGAPAAPGNPYARQRPEPRPVASRRDVTPAAEVAVDDMRSEVANQTFRRTRNEKEEVTKAEERIPWWKGGLWRNRGNNDEEEEDEEDAPPARSTTRSTRNDDYGYDDGGGDPVAARRDAYRDEEDDMWGDNDPYGASVSGQGRYNDQYDPYAQQNDYGPGGSSGGFEPYPAPPPGAYAQDPYAQQSYAQPPQSAAFGTDPNAPLGAYVDHAYGAVPAIDASTGQPITQQYAADPYASAPAPYAGGYDGGYDSGFVTGGMTQSDPYAMPMPPAGAAPAYDAQSGGPQFENAVRMVKENRFTEAKAILASETARNPSNAPAWRWLADCHYNLLELDDAIRAYQRSLDLDHSDYYALRGQGFSYLHRGHEYWRRMQEEVAQNRKEAAASTFALAHDDYKKALEMLGLCLRRAPNDGEAIYGEAMAAEGASRKLYSNAISYLKLGPDQRERAELFAENCLTVINKGIEQSKARSTQVPGDSGPRALLGGLYLRKATLYHQLGKNDLALIDLRNARDAQRSILDEIDKNNATAERAVREIETLWEQWGGNS